MKIFSLPVILIAAGVVVVGAGGLIYATSGYTDYRKPTHHHQMDAPAGTAQTSADGTPVSSDTSLSPNSNGSSDQANSGGGNGYRNGGGGGQNSPEREQRRQQRMQQMATELGLTDDQKAKMEEIRKTITDRTQRRAAIMAILTPDQQAKMEQMRAQRGNRGGGGNGGAGAGGQPPTTK